MNFTPTKGRLIIKPWDKKEKHGSIFIPDNAQESPMTALVVAAGPGCTITDGKVIIYPKYQGTEIVIEGETFLILHEDTVLAVQND